MPGSVRPWRAAVLAWVAAAAVLAGCGSSRPVGAVNVAESYLHDLADARYSAACGLFTDALRQRLGNCEQAVRRVVDGLPVGERDELRYVRVRKATYHGNQAQVYPADVTTDARSIAANHALDGGPLTLEKTGDAWRISDGVLNPHR
jgi:hypothetical protein